VSFFGLNLYNKKYESVARMWVTRSSEESNSYLSRQGSDRAHPPPLLQTKVLPDIMHCCFIYGHRRNFLKNTRILHDYMMLTLPASTSMSILSWAKSVLKASKNAVACQQWWRTAACRWAKLSAGFHTSWLLMWDTQAFAAFWTIIKHDKRNKKEDNTMGRDHNTYCMRTTIWRIRTNL
jgi:hypothetical protein